MIEHDPCPTCGTRLGHARDCKTFPLPERLVRKYGRDVPEGDGWSWDWQSDELAVEAAKEIRRLWNECSKCTVCGHHQAEPNWCNECGGRTDTPDWATLLVAAADAQANAEEFLRELKQQQIEFLTLVADGRNDYAEHALPGENQEALRGEVAMLRSIIRLLEGETPPAAMVAGLVPSWRWHEFERFGAKPS